jgi:hypothetical protein
VWRAAILEGVDEPAEFAGNVFVAKAKDLEDLPLDVMVVNSEGTTTGFVAVDDDVICISEDFFWLGVEKL